MDEETVELDIILVAMVQPGPNQPTKKTVSRKKYEELCAKYGTYGFSWYYTEYGIKYFDGEWHYQ